MKEFVSRETTADQSALLCVAAFRRCFFLLAFGLAAPLGTTATLEISMRPQVGDEALQLGSLRYETHVGERFSVTRLSYLLSEFAFQRHDGTWVELTNSIAWFDAEKARASVTLELPTSRYRALRFLLGLKSELNHANVAQFPADHALNPNLNGLHWSWQGGYVFMAFEGLWRDAEAFDGWSFHLARDTNRVCVVLDMQLELTNSACLEVELDVAKLLSGMRALSFAKDGSSTHSRDGDPVAAALVANAPAAFRARRVSEAPSLAQSSSGRTPLYLPERFMPYRFAIPIDAPIPDLPRDNPLVEERVVLGEKLFNEKLLSRDGTISCASCHERRAAFADPRRFSVGVSNRLGSRNAMPLFNLAWKSSFFWDGRASSLREQALMPIQDHAEMDDSLTNVVAKLTTAGYGAAFTRAFGSPEIAAEKIGLALEQFLLTLTSFDSKFDRSLRGEVTLTAEEKRGFELFMTEYDPRRGQFGADCFHCHGGPLFRSQSFANNGLDANFMDPGRAKVTGQSMDDGKFATPSLRNVELTAPYMHDGRFATLEDVVAHYSTGVKRSATLDPNLAKHPDGGLHLSSEDQRALVAFLKALTDQKFRNPNAPANIYSSLTISPIVAHESLTARRSDVVNGDGNIAK